MRSPFLPDALLPLGILESWRGLQRPGVDGGAPPRSPAEGTSRASRGEADEELICTQEWYGQSAGGRTSQQLGRTRQRERRGSTGSAGRSKAGARLAWRFFIEALLRCGRLGHHGISHTGARHMPNVGMPTGDVNTGTESVE